MSDFNFIAFVIFLFIIFGAFMAVFESSQNEYLLAENVSVGDEEGFDRVTAMTDLETGSEYGKMFMGGLAVLMGIVVIRFVRGQ